MKIRYVAEWKHKISNNFNSINSNHYWTELNWACVPFIKQTVKYYFVILLNKFKYIAAY